MKVTVYTSPDGYGTVTGDGEFSIGDNVTLTATSSFTNWPFIYYLIDGVKETTNPYDFVASNDDVTVTAIYDYKLFDYLKNTTGKTLDDGELISVITNRSLSVAILNEDATLEQRELCYADCLKIIITSPDSISTKRENWRESSSYTSKKDMINIMNGIYSKYGEDEIGGVITDASHKW